MWALSVPFPAVAGTFLICIRDHAGDTVMRKHRIIPYFNEAHKLIKQVCEWMTGVPIHEFDNFKDKPQGVPSGFPSEECFRTTETLQESSSFQLEAQCKPPVPGP